MTIEVAIMLSGLSVAFAFYQGITNNKRNQKADDRTEASQLTTVIVKLENIGTGITEIKSEMNNVKNEMKDDRERLIKLEESAKSAHKRMDVCEKYCKRFVDGPADAKQKEE
jgi:predicted RNase H-like nuclease (RuvC/YqgF family)